MPSLVKGCCACGGVSASFVVAALAVLVTRAPWEHVEDACSNLVSSDVRSLPTFPFRCGWQELRTVGLHPSLFAFVQPNGSWCWSNAGFISSKDGSTGLLVDTLTDPVLTQNMLNKLPGAAAGRTVAGVGYTHPDIDHVFGDQVLPDTVPRYGRSEVHKEMIGQAKSVGMLRVAGTIGHYMWSLAELIGVRKFEELHALKGMLGWSRLQWLFSRFSFHLVNAERMVGITQAIDGNEVKLPVVQGTIDEREVQMRYMGSIHSKSDSVWLVPDSKVCFAGDLLFIGIAPVMWAGPARSWVSALDGLLAETGSDWLFVPGHGPVTDVEGVQAVRRYFEHLDAAVTRLCEDPEAAAKDQACAERVLAELPFDLRTAFKEPQRILISAQIERKARRNGGPIAVDLPTKARLLAQQGFYALDGLL